MPTPATDPYRPLADRLRPQNLDEYVGQEHLLARGKPLREAIETASAFDDFLGAAGRRQDHPGAVAGGNRRCALRNGVGGAGRGEGNPPGGRSGAHAARGLRPPDHPVRRRSAPLQQVAAGCVPAVRRRRHADVHRRDHRKPLVRTQQRLAVARARLRAQEPRRSRPARTCSNAR